jgi:hypothetical protein
MVMAVTPRIAKFAVRCGNLPVRVVAAIVPLIGACAANAEDFKPLDQFIVTAIPVGIELEPRDRTLSSRALTYDQRKISNEQLTTFAQSICQSDTPSIQPLGQTWLQWLGNKTPARINC